MMRWLLAVGVMLTVVAINQFHLEEFRAALLDRLGKEQQQQLDVLGKPAEAFLAKPDYEHAKQFLQDVRTTGAGQRSNLADPLGFTRERLDWLFGHQLWIRILLTAVVAGALTWLLAEAVRRTQKTALWPALLLLLATHWWLLVLAHLNSSSLLYLTAALILVPMLLGALLGRHSRAACLPTALLAAALLGSTAMLVLYAEAVALWWKSHLHLLFGMGALVLPHPYALEPITLQYFGFCFVLVALPAFLGALASAAWQRRQSRRNDSAN